MARRKGRPRGLAPARKEGPDRKSLVKYVERAARTQLPVLTTVGRVQTKACVLVSFFRVRSCTPTVFRVEIADLCQLPPSFPRATGGGA